MTRKRVLQIVQHLRPGGIETMALDLMNRASSDREVHIASLEGFREDVLSAWPRLQPVADKLHFVGKQPGHDWRALVRLRRILRDNRFDVAHTHHIGPLIYGGIAARLAGIKKIVHTEHDAWHLSDPRRRRLQRAINLMVRPEIVADAKIVADAVRSHIRSINPVVIHNGVDTERFLPGDKILARRKLGLPSHVPLIGCAARLETVKRHEDLLKALAHMSPDYHLALAGDGSQANKLRQLAIALGIRDRVYFLGNLDDMPDFYRALDVFCLASEKEGLPLSPLEAQATGCPVVLTDTGGCREAACPRTGQLVAVGRVTDLANALSGVLQFSPSASPREFVVRHRNLDQTVQTYESLHKVEEVGVAT